MTCRLLPARSSKQRIQLVLDRVQYSAIVDARHQGDKRFVGAHSDRSDLFRRQPQLDYQGAKRDLVREDLRGELLRFSHVVTFTRVSMKRLYARIVLWLISPALRLQAERGRHFSEILSEISKQAAASPKMRAAIQKVWGRSSPDPASPSTESSPD